MPNQWVLAITALSGSHNPQKWLWSIILQQHVPHRLCAFIYKDHISEMIALVIQRDRSGQATASMHKGVVD